MRRAPPAHDSRMTPKVVIWPSGGSRASSPISRSEPRTRPAANHRQRLGHHHQVGHYPEVLHRDSRRCGRPRSSASSSSRSRSHPVASFAQRPHEVGRGDRSPASACTGSTITAATVGSIASNAAVVPYGRWLDGAAVPERRRGHRFPSAPTRPSCPVITPSNATKRSRRRILVAPSGAAP